MITQPLALSFEGTNAAVAAATTDVVTTVTLAGQHALVCFEVANTGQDLDAFDVQVQVAPDGTWISLASTWAATSPTLLWYSGNLAALATGAVGAAALRVYGVYAVRFRASSSAATTSVTVRGSAYANA